MRNKGLLFYKLGGYGFILFALLHALSFFTDPAQVLTREEDRRVWQTLATHVFSVQGFSTTVLQLLVGYNLYLSIFTLGMGLLNIVSAKSLAGNAAALRLSAAFNLIIVAALLIVTVIFFHLPPIIIFSAIFALFLAAFLTLV